MFKRSLKVRLALALGRVLSVFLIIGWPVLLPPAVRAEPRKVFIFSSHNTHLPPIALLNQATRSTSDWRELRRWSIDESKLPGSIIHLTEPTFWEQYRWRIIGIVSLCIMEALLIVGLLINRARRRQAEKETARFASLIDAERQRLNDLVSNVPGVVWEVRFEPGSHNPRVEFASDYVEKMLGYGAKRDLTLPGRGLSSISEEDREQVIQQCTAILGNGKEGVLQFRCRTKDEQQLWVETHLAAICDEIGQPVGLRGVTMDISNSRLAQESLRESEQRLRLGLQAARMIAWDWEPAVNRLITVGDVSEIYGVESVDDPQQAFSLVHPEDVLVHKSTIENSLANGGSYRSEFRIVRPDNGEVVWIEERGEAVRNGPERAKKIQGVVMDITERRRAEEAVRASETRFRTLADSAPVLIWMSGPDKLCTYFNQGWLTFTGRTIEEELGNGWTQRVHSEDYARCLEVYCAAFDRREPFKMEYRLRRADGIFRWIYDSGTPRFSSEGEFLGYIGSCVDISDRKEAEEALRRAHEEVSQLKNQLHEENTYLREEIKLAHNVEEIVGQSNAIKYVLFKVEQVSQTDSTVLILGETGTGKELVAHAIHNQSLRKDRPLVKVNCAALSPSLIESELFGHEKGAFTGASTRTIGRFELANRGTIFLDEIGELPPDLQAKLLRVVQEGELERLGSTKTIKVDVRILAATNRNLKEEVDKGRFREDLWYRLNVFPITVPPLNQRVEDIPEMVEHFVSRLTKKFGKEITAISSTGLKRLQNYSWPGNVRELANVIERAVIDAHGPVLQIADHFEQQQAKESVVSNKTLEEMEKEYIIRILDDAAWKIEGSNGAARILGLNPSTLRTRMVKLGIQKTMRAFAGKPGVTD